MFQDKRILLVEDNPKDEALTRRALERHNFQAAVVVARDGAEALNYLLGSDGTPAGALPQLVLLDLKLPKIDGLEVLRRIRANETTRLLPVVILTSSVEERDILEGYRLGTNSYVRTSQWISSPSPKPCGSSGCTGFSSTPCRRWAGHPEGGNFR